MAVYVDNVRIEWRGNRWCHMVADSIDELQSFAKKLGLKSEWFQIDGSYPHYDITIETRQYAIELGAVEGNRKNIIRCAKLLKIEYEHKNKNMKPIQLELV